MTVSCPRCTEPLGSQIASPGDLAHCQACGTEWKVRHVVSNPYSRAGFQGRLQSGDMGDARIIDHVDSVFVANAGSGRVGETLRRVKPPMPVLLAALAGIGVLVTLAQVPIMAAFQGGGNSPDLAIRNDLLEFQKVRSEIVDSGRNRRLVIEGELVNRTKTTLALPAIQVALKGESGAAIQRWRIDLARSRLGPHDSVKFRSAVAFPNAEARDVTLSLAPRFGRLRPVSR